MRVHVKGPGAVEVSGLAIDCHAGCEASVPPGTVVRLTAQAEAYATFEGWQGACGGTDACDLTLTREADVTARFAEGDPCAGIVPASLGTPVSATVPLPGGRRYCDGATSDGQGNVAHLVIGMGPTIWEVYASDGTPSGRLLDVFEVAEQASGFHAIGSGGFTVRGVDGTILEKQPAVAPGDTVVTYIFPARTGGSVVATADWWGCPNGVAGYSTLDVWRFAPSGALRGVVDIGGVGCPTGVVALSDDRDNTFVAVVTGHGAFGFPSARVIVRWLDANGTPLTPWTDVAGGGALEVAALIGGGVVFRAEDWVASFASGSSTPAASPAFMPRNHSVAIVRGGRAYAVVPKIGSSPDHSIELYSRKGSHCGTLEFPDHVALSVGLDGTVISIGTDDWCTANWWPHLLR